MVHYACLPQCELGSVHAILARADCACLMNGSSTTQWHYSKAFVLTIDFFHHCALLCIHCWLSIKKSFQPVKMKCWCDHLSGAEQNWFACGPIFCCFIKILSTLFYLPSLSWKKTIKWRRHHCSLLIFCMLCKFCFFFECRLLKSLSPSVYSFAVFLV